MPKKIGILTRVFSTADYREAFLDGKLYMNTIDFFRNYEEKDDGNIADVHEALSGWMHPHEFRLEIEFNGVKHVLNPEDMSGPMTTSMTIHKHANVFCMTHLHSHELDMSAIKGEEELELARSYFKLPKEVEKLGNFMVVISNPDEFLRRIKIEVQRLFEEKKAIWYSSKQVKYYDESNTSLILKDVMDAPFHKQLKYFHQCEFRICLIRDNLLNQPFEMNIGSIKDISIPIDTRDFNSMIELRVDNG